MISTSSLPKALTRFSPERRLAFASLATYSGLRLPATRVTKSPGSADGSRHHPYPSKRSHADEGGGKSRKGTRVTTRPRLVRLRRTSSTLGLGGPPARYASTTCPSP